MRGDVPEARDLRVLRPQVHDCVPYRVGERERALDLRNGEVADRNGDLLAARLCPQLGDHVLRQVDPMDVHAAPRQRQRDAARADTEFERRAAVSQLGEEVDDGVDDLRCIHLGRRLVVAVSDATREVVLRHATG